MGWAGQILASATPAHSSARSADRYFTLPVSAAFSHPTQLLGNWQEPSVTVRLRAKLAPLVASRFLSFSAYSECG